MGLIPLAVRSGWFLRGVRLSILLYNMRCRPDLAVACSQDRSTLAQGRRRAPTQLPLSLPDLSLLLSPCVCDFLSHTFTKP